MNSTALIWHLLNFLMPAAGLAALLVLALRVRRIRRPSAIKMWGWMFLTGTVVLVAGLWLLQRDGSMLTYAALVLVQATLAWRWSHVGRS